MLLYNDMKNIDNIWLVDDDEIYQYVTKTYFEFDEPKRNISTSFSGKEAMDHLLTANEVDFPDIILLDINMPKMNGWEFMDEFRKIKPNLKRTPSIFVVTSSENSNDKNKANDYEEIIDYIVKPVDDNKIKEIIKKAFE